MTQEELESCISKLEKRIHVLESTTGKMEQKITNFEVELFLPEAIAQYPDKTIRKRVTMKGMIDKITNVILNKPQSNILPVH